MNELLALDSIIPVILHALPFKGLHNVISCKYTHWENIHVLNVQHTQNTYTRILGNINQLENVNILLSSNTAGISLVNVHPIPKKFLG